MCQRRFHTKICLRLFTTCHSVPSIRIGPLYYSVAISLEVAMHYSYSEREGGLERRRERDEERESVVCERASERDMMKKDKIVENMSSDKKARQIKRKMGTKLTWQHKYHPSTWQLTCPLDMRNISLSCSGVTVALLHSFLCALSRFPHPLNRHKHYGLFFTAGSIHLNGAELPHQIVRRFNCPAL